MAGSLPPANQQEYRIGYRLRGVKARLHGLNRPVGAEQYRDVGVAQPPEHANILVWLFSRVAGEQGAVRVEKAVPGDDQHIRTIIEAWVPCRLEEA